MARENAIEAEGIIVDILRNGTCRVELANGHRVRAFLTGRARERVAQLALGDKVLLEMSPYDLSEGRIVFEDGKK